MDSGGKAAGVRAPLIGIIYQAFLLPCWGFDLQLTIYTAVDSIMANGSVSVKPYGFIIFRGDYSDDAKWERYMAYLKNQTRRGLESEDLVELYDRMDWKVIVLSLANLYKKPLR